MMKKLLLLILLIMPLCTYSQIEVVNESIRCDSNFSILEIGKFNWLKFKNLPNDAVLSVSQGMIKPDPKDKSRFYIPGKKDMEGSITNLKILSGGEIIFSKQFRFLNLYLKGSRDTLFGIIRLGKYKFPKDNSVTYCKDSIKADPFLYSLIEGVKIISFDVHCLNKRQDIVSYHIEGNSFERVVKERFGKKDDDKLVIENIILQLEDSTVFCGPSFILNHDKNCNN